MHDLNSLASGGASGAQRIGRARLLAAYPFRLFFPACAAYAVVAVGLWAAFLAGYWLPPGVDPILWHAHEMLFGMVLAAVAGFLLTAVANWTGRPALRGAPLAALGAVWLAGRMAMILAPGTVTAAIVDTAFALALTAFVAREIVAAGNRRNYLIVATLVALVAINIGLHGALMGELGVRREPMGAGLAAIALLMVVIGGRITPAFTANWLRLHGSRAAAVQVSPALDWAAILTTAALIPAELFLASGTTAWLALLAALVNGVRLVRWSGWRVVGEPLLWVLHLGYAWIVAALVLRGLGPVPAGIWTHALGVGAAGTLILGVMTRVALGHTGRTLRLPRTGTVIYLAISLAAALRLVALAAPGGSASALLVASATAWALAFAWFLVLYLPILTLPRVDGRPG